MKRDEAELERDILIQKILDMDISEDEKRFVIRRINIISEQILKEFGEDDE